MAEGGGEFAGQVFAELVQRFLFGVFERVGFFLGAGRGVEVGGGAGISDSCGG